MNMKKRQVMLKSRRTTSSSTTSSVVTTIIYSECQKNHAARIGGHAVDGCLEFMASSGGDDGTNDDNAALACAACGCHRNFHRKEVQSEVVCEYSPPDGSGRFR